MEETDLALSERLKLIQNSSKVFRLRPKYSGNRRLIVSESCEQCLFIHKMRGNFEAAHDLMRAFRQFGCAESIEHQADEMPPCNGVPPET